jgi:BlaI family penicillinase repressor
MSSDDPNTALADRYGPLELAIMRRLWVQSPADVRSVLSALEADGSDVAYSTVKTVMERLTRKGELNREREGRQYVYTPVRSRPQTEALAARGMVEDLFDRHGDLAVSYFVDRANRDPQQKQRLLDLLHRIEQDEDGA